MTVEPATAADLAAVQSWYDSDTALASTQRLAIREISGATVGIVDVRTQDSEATFRFVGVEPARRGFGLGGEAVRLVEQWAVEKGLRHFRAEVDHANGLGLYFWLRLGYIPIEPSLNDQGRAVQPMVRRV